MRFVFIGLVGVLSSFSPPPCQKVNSDFMGEDAGHDEGADASGSESDSIGSASATSVDTSASTTSTTSDPTGVGDSESTGANDPCPTPGEELCGAQCVDTSSHPNHCGMCGNKCHPVHESCQNSRCMPT